MKKQLLLITFLIFQLNNIKPSTISFLASSAAAGATYYYSSGLEDKITDFIIQCKQGASNNLLEVAQELDENAKDIGKIAKKATNQALKQQGKNFLSRWWQSRKAANQAEEITHQAANELSNQAEEINNVNKQQLKQAVSKYYPYARITTCILVFLLTNKLLS